MTRGFEAWEEAAPIDPNAWERLGAVPPPPRPRQAWRRAGRYGWLADHEGASFAVSFNRVDGRSVWVAYRGAERVGKASSWPALAALLPAALRVELLPP